MMQAPVLRLDPVHVHGLCRPRACGRLACCCHDLAHGALLFGNQTYQLSEHLVMRPWKDHWDVLPADAP
jgi:hypothetical protein